MSQNKQKQMTNNKAIKRKPTQLTKIESKTMVGRVVENTDIGIFAKSIIKNAPNLISVIPGVGPVVAASAQTAVGTVVDYWDDLRSKKREEEMASFNKKLDERLSHLEIKVEAKDYFENSIIFKYEDIKRKLFTEPGRGFDDLLAEFVATALSDLDTPVDAKDLILSTLLSIDSIDLKVLKQIDTQFKANVNGNSSPGVKVDILEPLMKSSGVDSIMIGRALQRLQGQDLIYPVNPSQASAIEMPSKGALLEGAKSPQYYPASGFGISLFGRRFLRFLKLSD